MEKKQLKQIENFAKLELMKYFQMYQRIHQIIMLSQLLMIYFVLLHIQISFYEQLNWELKQKLFIMHQLLMLLVAQVSVPFFTEKWKHFSFYPKIKANLDHNLHTLVLLDIKVKELSKENLAREKKFMKFQNS